MTDIADIIGRDRPSSGQSGGDTPSSLPRAEFLDMQFDLACRDRARDLIVRRDQGAPFRYVVTPNVDHLVRLQSSRSDLWPVYRSAWMTLCDSRILARLARIAGIALPLVPGSDLTRDLLRRGIAPDDRIAILGGGAASTAMLREKYGLTNLVHHDPPMGFVKSRVEMARAVEFLVGARARYSFLAVGSPQQEIVAHHVARSGEATGIGLCVGASLDFLVGRQVRAPWMVQRLGLEWMFRLLSNPRRFWRRYLVEGPAIFLIFARWRRGLA